MRRSWTPILLAVALLVGASACGGDGDDDASTDAASPTTSGAGDETTDPTTGDERIDDLIERARESTFRIVYETGDGDRIVLAQDPPRYAFLQGDSGTYQTADGEAVTCSGIDDPESAECTILPVAGDFLTQGFTTVFGGAFAAIVIAAAEDDALFGTVELTDEQLLGRDAKCARFDPGSAPFIPATGTWQVCVDEETGAVLRSSGTDPDGNRTDVIEAVEFGDPDDDELDPPAEPVEITIPPLPDGITIPTFDTN